ncbi:hypothetical protein OsJ_34551 [Oryza sativa Japonica Group]|uniref:GTPase Der n=1 Tax=Oryza sativa subsp. japonica TaxID=39947 RepID=B9G8G1_ORYSJ|nr:hypothetical protein OsJ_34551 [Oryza sativa Japonica Group]
MATTSTSSLLPLLPSRTPTPTPRRRLPFAAAAAAAAAPPRPFLVSSPPPPPAPRARLARRAAAGGLYGGGGGEEEGDGEDGEMEEEYYDDGDEEGDWEDDDAEEGEEMDVEAMEEEALGAVADLSERLSRELRIDDDVRDKRRIIRDKTSASKHIPDNLLPRVAIIGRPNVGKSALFNRLVGDGLVAADIEIADWLRRNYSDKHIILAVNKCESPRKGQMQALDFWSLGFSPLPISAITGTGTGELLDMVCSELSNFEELDGVEEDGNYIPAIAIVGRPNVGKSSILNALVGEDRTIVSPVSGTTRDAIDTEFTTEDGQKYKLIDTAGIRRRAAVASAGSTTETLSVKRAFRAIRRSDVVALVVEAMACITEQDYKIAERIEKEGKACVIVVNKWDTIPNKNHQSTTYYEQDVREKLRILDWAPIVYCSATHGSSVDKIISAAALVEKERSRRLGTSILNQVVREAIAFKPPPRTRGGKRGRVYYTTQAAIRPPTFVFFVNDAKLFPETFRRYMEKKLRSDAGFPGTPIRLLWRSRKRPDKKGKSADNSLQSSVIPSRMALAT